MNHLFIARHGEFDRHTGKLSEDGKRSIEFLGMSIRDILDGQSAYLVTSTAPRALESSDIISASLGINGYEQLEYLWEGYDSPHASAKHDESRLLQIIGERNEKADGLIVLTHSEVLVTLYMGYMAEHMPPSKFLGVVRCANAVHFDILHKTAKVIH